MPTAGASSRTRRSTAVVSAGIAVGTLAALGVAPGAGAVTATVAPAAAPRPIVIAAEAPLSGPQASNGRDMLRGVQLAAQQVNARGGVLGRQIRVMPIDDKADPGRARAAVAAARAAGAVAVVGPYNSSVGVVNLPLYLKAGIVPVQMTSTNETDGMGVTVQPKNNQIAPVEARFVLGTKATRVAMLVDPSTYTKGMADRLRAALTARGVRVTTVPVVEGRSDYDAAVAAALRSRPDLVYVSTYYPEGSVIAKRLLAVGGSTPCLEGLANVDPAFVRRAGLAASQRCSFSGVPAAAQLPTQGAAPFVAAYRSAFGAAPGVWGIFTYDSANLLFTAMRSVRGTGFSPVLAALRRTTAFPGATGKITIAPTTGNRVSVPVFILKVDARGTFVPVS